MNNEKTSNNEQLDNFKHQINTFKFNKNYNKIYKTNDFPIFK